MLHNRGCWVVRCLGSSPQVEWPQASWLVALNLKQHFLLFFFLDFFLSFLPNTSLVLLISLTFHSLCHCRTVASPLAFYILSQLSPSNKHHKHTRLRTHDSVTHSNQATCRLFHARLVPYLLLFQLHTHLKTSASIVFLITHGLEDEKEERKNRKEKLLGVKPYTQSAMQQD